MPSSMPVLPSAPDIASMMRSPSTMLINTMNRDDIGRGLHLQYYPALWAWLRPAK